MAEEEYWRRSRLVDASVEEDVGVPPPLLAPAVHPLAHVVEHLAHVLPAEALRAHLVVFVHGALGHFSVVEFVPRLCQKMFKNQTPIDETYIYKPT